MTLLVKITPTMSNVKICSSDSLKWSIYISNCHPSFPCGWKAAGSSVTSVPDDQGQQALGHWYLSPWGSWRGRHWWRRGGIQWAGRRSHDGADSPSRVSKCQPECPQQTVSQRGPPVHRFPGREKHHHLSVGRVSPWKGCSLEHRAGWGRGPDRSVTKGRSRQFQAPKGKCHNAEI